MRVLIEGPDKTGKSTLVKTMAEADNVAAYRLPNDWYREKLITGKVKDLSAFFLFCSETAGLWEHKNLPKHFILDRDILSMIVYQGILLNGVNPMLILNLYKSVIYKKNRPDKIIYLVNPPFEEYDKDDRFEALGYEAIRTAYDEAYRLVELNFPEIECRRVHLEKVEL